MDDNKVGATLFYFAFGIDITSDDGKKMERCAEKAYLDLCRTIKYNEGCNERKNCFKTKVIKLIIEAIEEYPGTDVDVKNDNNSFDRWHKKLCDEIIDEAEKQGSIFMDEKSISYGQCQKWINMTIKYMRLMGILPERIKQKDIHIPLDNYVLNAVSKKGFILENGGIEGLDICNPFKNAWSRIDNYNEYLEYQRNIRNKFESMDISAVEWEDEAWLAMAVYESSKE